MADSAWKSLVTVADTLSAQALIDRLQLEGVPARIESDSSLLGAARLCHVMVPTNQVHRARRLLEAESFTDAELRFLATGELDDEPPTSP